MATSRSCIKLLKGPVKQFLLYLVVKILQLVYEIAVSRRCSIKEVFCKTQNSQINTRSSHPEMFCKRKDVLKNFAKFTENFFCRSLFL